MVFKTLSLIACLVLAVVTTGSTEPNPLDARVEALVATEAVEFKKEQEEQERLARLDAQAKSEADALAAALAQIEADKARIAAEQAAAEEAARQEAARVEAERVAAARRATTTTIGQRAASQAPAPSGSGPTDAQLAALRQCESGGNYQANTGNGYYGAYQFLPSTWRSMGTGYDMPHHAPPAVQDDAARRLIIRSGWGQFPACSRKIGAR